MKKSPYLLLFLSAPVFFFAGFGFKSSSLNSGVTPQTSRQPALQKASSSVIKAQQALAVGEITKKSDTSITVKDEQGKESEFKFGPGLSIYSGDSGAEASQSSRVVKPQTDKSAVKTGQKALITLELQGDEYLVKTISYISNP